MYVRCFPAQCMVMTPGKPVPSWQQRNVVPYIATSSVEFHTAYYRCMHRFSRVVLWCRLIQGMLWTAHMLRNTCLVPVALNDCKLLTQSAITAHANKCLVSVTLHWSNIMVTNCNHRICCCCILHCSGYTGLASKCCMLVLCS